MEHSQLKTYIRDVPDYPKPGILFKDITPLLGSGEIFRHSVQLMCDPFEREVRQSPLDFQVCGIESRGFIFAAAMAQSWGAGLVPLRKKGKLPWKTLNEEYALEYGVDHLEIHEDAFSLSKKVILVDDVLATGGTMAAAARLIERAGGELLGACVLIELDFLKGREKLSRPNLHSVLRY